MDGGVNDLISRKKAIDTVRSLREKCDTGDISDYADMMVEALSVLPSAQPTGDLISRQEAIEALEHDRDTMPYEYSASDAIITIKALPSAQKQGKWIFAPDDSEGICTMCQYKISGVPYEGQYLIVPYNYCPNCGADMRGEQE